MRVEVMSTEHCPAAQATLRLVREAAEEMGLPIELVHVELHTAEEAARLRFPGSPTVRVNGEEIDPAAGSISGFGLA